MLSELESDIAIGNVYVSKVTHPGTEPIYFDLMRDAFAKSDASALAREIASSGIVRSTQDNGNAVNLVDAAARLGDGQFVAYYARAVCLRAISAGREIEIYRGQDTAVHRHESDIAISSRPDPVGVLEELRTHSLEPWRFSTIAKVNSGLSIKLA